MAGKIVTLTSDFGLKDPYVAEMKAAIVSLCPAAKIIDITHMVNKFDIREGAFMLASATPYFPKGTINIAVVDPAVGSIRRPIIIQTTQGFFVGPDNGLLILAAEKQGIQIVREITNKKLMLPIISSTFHGRDIFAPAAAHLANGVPFEEFGSEVIDAVKPTFSKVIIENDCLIGEALFVDDFGNIVTNINGKDFDCPKGALIRIDLPRGSLHLKLSKTYTDVKPKQTVLLSGSQGYMEIAINQGNAAKKFKVKGGERIALTKPKSKY